MCHDLINIAIYWLGKIENNSVFELNWKENDNK